MNSRRQTQMRLVQRSLQFSVQKPGWEMTAPCWSWKGVSVGVKSRWIGRRGKAIQPLWLGKAVSQRSFQSLLCSESCAGRNTATDFRKRKKKEKRRKGGKKEKSARLSLTNLTVAFLFVLSVLTPDGEKQTSPGRAQINGASASPGRRDPPSPLTTFGALLGTTPAPHSEKRLLRRLSVATAPLRPPGA